MLLSIHRHICHGSASRYKSRFARSQTTRTTLYRHPISSHFDVSARRVAEDDDAVTPSSTRRWIINSPSYHRIDSLTERCGVDLCCRKRHLARRPTPSHPDPRQWLPALHGMAAGSCVDSASVMRRRGVDVDHQTREFWARERKWIAVAVASTLKIIVK